MARDYKPRYANNHITAYKPGLWVFVMPQVHKEGYVGQIMDVVATQDFQLLLIEDHNSLEEWMSPNMVHIISNQP